MINITVDTMYTTVDFNGRVQLAERVRGLMHHQMGIKIEGAQYSRAYKSGVWDGITDFYDMKEDKFHTGLLPQFLEGIRKLQEKDPTITYEITDVREERLVDPENIDEEIVLGNGDEEPITLRDYQYESVKSVFREQVGILNLATNGGKCLSKNTNILTSKGYRTLEEIFLEKGVEVSDEEAAIPMRYPLINRYGKVEYTSHFTRNGVKPVKHITTNKGIELEVTYNHPLLVVENDSFVWKKSEDIKEKDLLVSRVGDNVFGNDQTVQTEEEAYVLGVIIADGCISRKEQISVTNNQPEINDILQNYFSHSEASVKFKPDRNTFETIVSGTEYVERYLNKYNITKGVAKDKFIPDCIMQAPKNIQLAFLSGLIECECYIASEKKSLEFTSASEKLVKQLQLVLQNLGIVSTLKQKVVKGYEDSYYGRLTVSSHKYVTKLVKLLTFRTVQRKEQFNELVINHEKVSINKSYGDTLPNGKKLMEEYKRTLNIKGKELKSFDVPNTISRDRARKLITEFPNGDKNLFDTIVALLDENLFFQEVKVIQEGTPQPTFDVSMERTSSFIAEGIVNHNTEAAAGVIQQVIPYLKRGERVAFFTHSKEIFHQSAERIRKRLNLRESDIGKVGDGKFSIKNKKIVFVMIPTLVSSLKDPKKGVSFTPKERVIKLIAEDIAPKFSSTTNTRHLLQNYIKNCQLTTKVWQSAEEELMYIAYDKKFTDKTAKLQLNKYVAEFNKILEKKNSKKFKKYSETMDFLNSVKVMIGDEIHHAKAETWYNALSLCNNATIRVGLTGTPDEKDKMGWQRLQAIFSSIISKVSNDYLIKQGVSSKPIIRVLPIKEPRDIEVLNNYQEVYKQGIAENDYRNDAIIKLALGYNKRKQGGVLISVTHIEHGQRLQDALLEHSANVRFIHGDLEANSREEFLQEFGKGNVDFLIASSIIDEGVDLRSIGCIVLAAGGKSMRQQLQRIGRGLRLNGIDGNQVIVFDFYDQTNKFLLNHSKERVKIFKEEQFDIKFMGE